jgi:hypothetical protein
MKTRHLIILIGIVLALLTAAPVSAYTISVYGGTASPAVSSNLQSVISGYQNTRPQSTIFDILANVGNNTGASQGSINAYSSVNTQTNNQLIRFSESVTVTGRINTFSYSANFKL